LIFKPLWPTKATLTLYSRWADMANDCRRIAEKHPLASTTPQRGDRHQLRR
jgi:hypothetical protein